MVEFVLGGLDLSPYTEPKKLTVTRKNIIEDISLTDSFGTAIPKVIGSFYEINGNLTAVPEETATALMNASGAKTVEVTFPLPGALSATRTMNFTRPELSVTAVCEKSDGDYYDIKISLRSENAYSDDCL